MKIRACILFFIFIMLCGCSSREQKDYTFFAMDTVIQLSFYNEENTEEISKEVEKIYLKYSDVSDDFTSTRGVMNVYDLNQKREGALSLELKEMLIFAMEMKEDTDGYFNPFIGRLSHLWKEALKNKRVLEPAVIEKELQIMHNTTLLIENDFAKLEGEGNLDLGGLAKGFATQKVKEYLDTISCKGYMLNAGSSSILLGEKYGDSFKVGLSRATASGYYCTLNIKNKAIATSSIAQQLVEIEGQKYSHILNPKTGYPVMQYDSLSIIGEASDSLDVYSTACFSMSIDEIESFLKRKELDYIISLNNQLLTKSSGVDNYA